MDTLGPLRKDAHVRIVTYAKDPAIATVLEAIVFEDACRPKSFHGIPIHEFSSGVFLFETDRFEAHVRELLMAYTDAVARLEDLFMIPETREQLVKNPYSLRGLEDHNVVGHTAYGLWQESHFQELQRSKAVLQERTADTGVFITCKKCKSNAIDVDQKQTRSADEPMTLFCMCRSCGARFVMR